jgi:tRNA threonylcarbamoyl adenosine modification protein (Sua5/YciO/YrdC/YwlC family)
LKIDPVHPEDATLDEAAGILSRGGPVVAPTETRYGLLARADSQPLLERLYALKSRPLDQATAVMVGGSKEIETLGDLTPVARVLSERFLPGPLTLVLRARLDWPPPRVVDGKIGLRWSSSPVIDGLLRRLSCPLTATSANISGRPDPESVEEIMSQFGDRVDLYLDAGPLTGPTSTVVDCSGPKPRILRDGAIPRADIERAIEHMT